MVSHNADEVKAQGDLWRGKTAWHMQLVDVVIGHEALGFDCEMSGDLRPGVPS